MSASFVERVTFSAGLLELDLTDGRTAIGKLRFDFVRSFAFLKESDFWREMAGYETTELFAAEAAAPLVSRINKGAVLERVLGGRLNEEDPSFYLVWTADECFEVVSFSEPEWAPVSAGDG